MTIETIPRDGSRWDDATTPSLNAIFKVLSVPTRREALVVIRSEDEPIPVSELADRLDGETDRMRIALVHVHLPMLDEAGLVAWDSERESVEFVDFPDAYEDLFEVADSSVR
ncbi:hypothetical protein ZOD2009_12892 [Haladaptatus paucihalophilus DX253]|uniref:DUF7344 domain-containing protein n=1 Tax=Haladaptatus paucihalophilus DX253 TaxID=797209 RepID=E7QUU3_HALPU|nr:helix-turn-helix transcriptional regulator [Haladaptatus paucihalophilus]EFW91750.1 hypothetical protein ZOD2009_12892 [Haladaptatus paucihalophilus DX253]SHJ95109.1 hypothetical protein SAMN05444342_0052 [Haladaptatus paucihalophilus DX253]